MPWYRFSGFIALKPGSGVGEAGGGGTVLTYSGMASKTERVVENSPEEAAC